ARADDGGNILDPGAASALLDATVELAGQPRPALAIKYPHTFGPVEPVRGKRKQIRADGLHVQRQPSGAGFGIDVERDTALGGDGANLTHWLQGADVMVHVLDGDENSSVCQRSAHVLRLDKPRGIHF